MKISNLKSTILNLKSPIPMIGPIRQTLVAMVVKGGFLLLSNEDTCRSALQWCLSREAVDYRFWGLGLCALSILLIHALGGFGAQ